MMIQVIIYVKQQLHGTINFGWVFLGLFTDGEGKKVLLPNICHTYSTMIKFRTVAPPKFCYYQSFLPLTLVISRNTDIDRILIHSF